MVSFADSLLQASRAMKEEYAMVSCFPCTCSKMQEGELFLHAVAMDAVAARTTSANVTVTQSGAPMSLDLV